MSNRYLKFSMAPLECFFPGPSYQKNFAPYLIYYSISIYGTAQDKKKIKGEQFFFSNLIIKDSPFFSYFGTTTQSASLYSAFRLPKISHMYFLVQVPWIHPTQATITPDFLQHSNLSPLYSSAMNHLYGGQPPFPEFKREASHNPLKIYIK